MTSPHCRLCRTNHWAREGCPGSILRGGAAPALLKTDTKKRRPASKADGKRPRRKR